MAKKTNKELMREIAEFLAEGRNESGHGYKANRVARVGFGTFSSSSTERPKRRAKEQWPGQHAALERSAASRKPPALWPRSESEQAIHPEMFACMDRNGKILGTSRTVRGAMGYAPNNQTYAKVRGEFTSDGTNHGVGGGRTMAVREAGRWQVG